MELIIRMKGEVEKTNFKEFKVEVEKQLAIVSGKAIDSTDDAKLARDTIKYCQDIEAAITQAKELALAQTADIKQVFEALDELSGKSARARIDLKKKVDDYMATQKKKIIDDQVESITLLVKGHVAEHPEFARMYTVNRGAYELAVKGKSSLESMQKAVRDLFTVQVGIIGECLTRLIENKTILDAACAENKHLFPDYSELAIAKDKSIVVSTVEARVAKYELELAEKEKKARELAERAEKAKADALARGPIVVPEGSKENAATTAVESFGPGAVVKEEFPTGPGRMSGAFSAPPDSQHGLPTPVGQQAIRSGVTTEDSLSIPRKITVMVNGDKAEVIRIARMIDAAISKEASVMVVGLGNLGE